MRLFRLLIALACLAAGIAVGGLNTQAVQLDLGFAQLPTSLGVAVLVALLLGVVVGGLALAAGVVLPWVARVRGVDAAPAVSRAGSTGVASAGSWRMAFLHERFWFFLLLPLAAATGWQLG